MMMRAACTYIVVYFFEEPGGGQHLYLFEGGVAIPSSFEQVQAGILSISTIFQDLSSDMPCAAYIHTYAYGSQEGEDEHPTFCLTEEVTNFIF